VGTSLEAPLAELEKTKMEEFPTAALPKTAQVAGERKKSRSDKNSVADEYAKKQRNAMVRVLTESKKARGALTESPLV
jgi:hypothetical protein